MNPACLPDALVPSLARLGVAAAMVIGPADVKERLRLAEAGELDTLTAGALRAELDMLAEMLAGG